MIKKILIITLLVSLIPAQYVLAEPEIRLDSEKPPVDGDWDEGIKSLFFTSRIEVDITGSQLTISSKTLRSDITIRISESDETIFLQTVPASETGQITIDLSNFEPGSYFLELTNQWGDYLHGYFQIE
jgi:hypothetical protein